MTYSLNRITLLGHLGQDPVARFSNAGTAFTTFSVATTTRWRDRQTQEQREETEWHSVVCWGPLAEIASKHLHKGSQVYVEGELRTRKWERDGVQQQRAEVRARDLIMLSGQSTHSGSTTYGKAPQSGHQRAEKDQQRSQQSSTKSSQSTPQPDLSYDDIDDDIPF